MFRNKVIGSGVPKSDYDMEEDEEQEPGSGSIQGERRRQRWMDGNEENKRVCCSGGTYSICKLSGKASS